MSSYHFTFLRHGESIGNRDGFVQGQHDFALSPQGVLQVRHLADQWQQENRQFDGIITSPLKRAIQTAEVFQEALGLPLTMDPLWMERSRGKSQGLPHKDADEKFPTPTPMPLFHPYGETGESEWQLSLRAGQAVQSLFKHPPGRYLIVSHGGILNKVIHLLLGIKNVRNAQGVYFVLNNTGYCEFMFADDYEFEEPRWFLRSYVQPEPRIFPMEWKTDSRRFVFLRHAQSEGNLAGLFQGQHETPLTEAGRVQAQAIANHLKAAGYAFNLIISSPQDRTRETAQSAAEAFQLPLTFDERLMEIDNGGMAGLNGEEIADKYPRQEHRKNPYLPLGETGESWLELYLRAGSFLDSLVSQPPGEVLIVSHGALLNSLMLAVLGIVPQPNYRPPLFIFGNTGYADLLYNPSTDSWSFLGLISPPKDLQGA